MIKKLIAISLSAFILCSCSNLEVDNGDSFNIVTSFYPVMLMTKAVTGDSEDITVTNLANPNDGCLHDYTLSTKDMKVIEKADVLVINGLGMEPFIDKITASMPELKIINLSDGIEPVDGNSHIWLSPEFALKMVNNLSTELGKIVPQHKSAFADNAKSFTDDINTIHIQTKDRLSGLQSVDTVIFHDSFQYIMDSYGISVKYSIETDHDHEPSTGEITKAIDIIKQFNIKAIFADGEHIPKAAQAAAKETGADIYGLDPINAGENSDSADQFLIRMEQNSLALQQAFKKED